MCRGGGRGPRFACPSNLKTKFQYFFQSYRGRKTTFIFVRPYKKVPCCQFGFKVRGSNQIKFPTNYYLNQHSATFLSHSVKAGFTYIHTAQVRKAQNLGARNFSKQPYVIACRTQAREEIIKKKIRKGEKKIC